MDDLINVFVAEFGIRYLRERGTMLTPTASLDLTPELGALELGLDVTSINGSWGPDERRAKKYYVNGENALPTLPATSVVIGATPTLVRRQLARSSAHDRCPDIIPYITVSPPVVTR